MKKAILFDLDNTLYDSARMAMTARKESCIAMVNAGLNAPNSNAAFEKLQEIIKEHGSNYAGHLDRLCEAFGEAPNPRIVAAGIVAYHKTKSALLHLFPGVDQMLVQLIKQGFKLGIVTNGIAVKQWDKIHRLGIAEFFDTIIVSDNEATKSSKDELIKQALNDLEVKSEEAVFVGDSPEADIQSANRVGVMSVLVSNQKEDLPEAMEPTHTVMKTSQLMDIL